MIENTVGNFAETVVLKEEKSMRVLHVDDDEEDFLKVARLCLETEGAFEVESAFSVDDALVKLVNECLGAAPFLWCVLFELGIVNNAYIVIYNTSVFDMFENRHIVRLYNRNNSTELRKRLTRTLKSVVIP
jgi:hypothetical protein